MRTTDYKLTSWVNVKNVVAFEEGCCLWCECLDEHWKKNFLYILTNLSLHCFVNSLLTELSATVCIVHVAE